MPSQLPASFSRRWQHSVNRRVRNPRRRPGSASVAGNGRRLVISGVDAAAGANRWAGAGNRLDLGGWRTALWYQDRSRVVPGWCRAAKGVQGAILSIANAYTNRPQATPDRRQKAECRMQKARAKPPKATSKPPARHLQANRKPSRSHPHASLMRPSSHLQARGKPLS